MRDVGTLLEALPYIREFHGKTVVIKYGGAAMVDPALREEFARDVVLLKYVGLNPVVVHGGGPEITEYMKRLGLPVKFVGGLRVSDAQTVEVAKMVLVGKVNKDIVQRLGRHGQAAVGLSGDDGNLFRVSRQTAPGGEDIGFVGRIDRVDVDVLEHIAQDYIPVIASVGADREGTSYNVNADEAAAAVARAMGALSSEDYAARLIGRLDAAKTEAHQKGTLEEWIVESHKLAREKVYQDKGEALKTEGHTLSEDYLKDGAEVAELQLTRGGLRLAKFLNDAFENGK